MIVRICQYFVTKLENECWYSIQCKKKERGIIFLFCGCAHQIHPKLLLRCQ